MHQTEAEAWGGKLRRFRTDFIQKISLNVKLLAQQHPIDQRRKAHYNLMNPINIAISVTVLIASMR